MLAAVAAVAAAAGPCRADAVVDLCHADNEAGAPGRVNLGTALARGGRITFNCPPPATIAITRSHDIGVNTEIDGGSADRVLLDGGRRSGVMFRVSGANAGFALARISIARAVSPGRETGLSNHAAGAVVDLTGGSARLALTSVEVRDSASPFYLGGGQLVVRNSRFQDNTGTVIDSSAAGDIADSSFIGNDTALSLHARSADVHLVTTLAGAVVFANHRSSAVVVGVGGRLDASGTQFTGNTGAAGAALSIDGLADWVTLRKTVWDGNVAQQNGGAIEVHRHATSGNPPPPPPPAGPVVLRVLDAAFRNNRAPAGAGGALHADLFNGGAVQIGGARFVGNSAAVEGGALSLRPGGALSITNSLFKANAAPRAAAMMLVRANAGSRVANTLVVGNVAQPGGGAVAANAVDFVNVTIADNDGSGIADGSGSRDMRDIVAGAPRVRFVNAVIADNRPSNCAGALRADGNGASLQSPSATVCPGAEISAAAMLDTWYAPLPGSPALGHGKLADCMAAPIDGRDVVAQKRGVGGYCSIGAFEAAPTRRAEDLVRKRPPPGQDPNHGD